MNLDKVSSSRHDFLYAISTRVDRSPFPPTRPTRGAKKVENSRLVSKTLRAGVTLHIFLKEPQPNSAFDLLPRLG